MCGIVGVISKEPRQLQYSDLSLFNEMLICGSIRGDDSTGVFSVNEHGNVNFLKLATPPYNLIKSVDGLSSSPNLQSDSFNTKIVSPNCSAIRLSVSASLVRSKSPYHILPSFNVITLALK